MGFVRMIEDGGARRRLERLVGRDVVRALPDPQGLRAARKEEAEARAQIRSIEPAAEVSRARRAGNPALAALTAAKERHAVAMHQLDTMELRPLACYEQTELLHEAVSNARRALLVTSAGLQPTVLTQHMMRDLDRITGERVAITVTSFLKPQIEARGGDFYDPLSELTKRAQKNRMQLLTAPRSDLFFLIQDDDLAVISNRPFLGEMVRRSGFQRIEGYVTRDRSTVEKIREISADALRARRNA